MEIILLILLLISIGINFFLLIKSEKKINEPKIEKKPKLTREEKEKQEQIKKAFDNLMSYDESIARKMGK